MGDGIYIIITRGEKFRMEFSHLGEVRSIIPRVIALTATATITTQKVYYPEFELEIT